MLTLLAQAAAATAEAAAKPPAEKAVPADALIRDVSKDPIGSFERLVNSASDWAMTQGPRVLLALLLLLVGWIAAGWTRRLMLNAFGRAHLDLTLSKFLGNLVKWAIIAFALVACLGTFGVNTTSFAALIAAAGLAVGLALQGNLSNLASGVLLLIFRPFKIGDAVIVAGQTGVVDGIDLFTTNLDTADNRRIIVPNGAIFSGVIENQTRHPTRQVLVNVQVSGAAGIDAAQGLLLGAARRVLSMHIGANAEPAPSVALAEITPTTTFAVGLWCATPAYLAVRQALLREIKAAVDANDLAPAAPAMNIHVRSMPEPAR